METCDVIVIGGGSAAFDAAVAANENGADRVVMLEKAPEPEYGGNARYSGTGFRFWHGGAEEIREFVPDIDDDYFKTLQISPYTKRGFSADLERMTLGRMDPELARTLVEQSNAAVHWMKDAGIRWELLKEHAKVGDKRYFERGIAIHVAGGGVGQLEQWRRIAEDMGIEIRFSSPVSAIHGNMHRVEGVRVCRADTEYDITARAVIACAGGFQASAEMRARYLAGNADFVKVRGSKHDTGGGPELSSRARSGDRRPLAVRPHVADRRQSARLRDAAARRRPRQYAEPLRLSIRHHRQCTRLALLRRRRGAAFLHLRQDRPRRSRAARRYRLADL